MLQLFRVRRVLVFLVQMAQTNHLREVLLRRVALAPVGLALPAKPVASPRRRPDLHQHSALRYPLDERPHELAVEFSWDPLL